MVKVYEMRSGRVREMSARDAAILIKLGKHRAMPETPASAPVKAAPVVATAAPIVASVELPVKTVEPTIEPPEMMESWETPQEPETVESVGEEISVRTGRPKRRYTRRDMTAEE